MPNDAANSVWVISTCFRMALTLIGCGLCTIAVLGAKSEWGADAWNVPRYFERAGYSVRAVNPKLASWGDAPAWPTLAAPHVRFLARCQQGDGRSRGIPLRHRRRGRQIDAVLAALHRSAHSTSLCE